MGRPWWSKGGPRAPQSRFLSHVGRISAPFWNRFCIDFRLEIMSGIEVEKKCWKIMKIFARGHGNHKLAQLLSNLLVFATPLMLFQYFFAPGRGAEEPGGGLEEAWRSLGEALSKSLECPRSHLGSAQETGGAEERFLLPLSRFGGVPGGMRTSARLTRERAGPREG